MEKATVDALFTGMIQSGQGVSDLLFIEGKPPLVDINGSLQPFAIDTPGAVLTSEIIEDIASGIIKENRRLLATFTETGSCDCSYPIPGVARLRVNIYRQRGRHAMVVRKLESKIPTLDELHLPEIFRDIIKEKNGIVLVTGASGSGKSTTLAAMINELNQTKNIHILTLEDPIEFLHSHGKAVISHRELGRDFPTFAEGLRAALRQAPKVILVGEIRDRETMEIAMTAAETGHVVFSTLHTINAGQTISRILSFFNREEEPQLRDRLSETVRYIISQRLVDKAPEGRLLITEVMGNNLRTRETIRCGESENKSFHEIIEAAAPFGWHTFDQSLLRAREQNLISDETVLMFCSNKGGMRGRLDLLQKKGTRSEPAVASGLKLHIPEKVVVPTDASP